MLLSRQCPLNALRTSASALPLLPRAPTAAAAAAAPRRLLSSWITDVPMGPPDPILGLNEAFQKDPNPKKVSLGVGAYRDDEGKPYVLPSVIAAEGKLAGTNKEYAGMAGIQPFVDLSLKFAYADAGGALAEGRVAGVQAMSGTGACSLAGAFFKKFVPGLETIYVRVLPWLPGCTHEQWLPPGREQLCLREKVRG
jgi:aspartate aminotransferase